jgi:hypothetical protein
LRIANIKIFSQIGTLLPALKGGKAFCCNSFLEKQNKTKKEDS